MAKSLNIDHSTQSIISNDGTAISIAPSGSVQIGSGVTSEEDSVQSNVGTNLLEYSGCLRFNSDTRKLEYCDGSKWVEIIDEDIDEDNSFVYSSLF